MIANNRFLAAPTIMGVKIECKDQHFKGDKIKHLYLFQSYSGCPAIKHLFSLFTSVCFLVHFPCFIMLLFKTFHYHDIKNCSYLSLDVIAPENKMEILNRFCAVWKNKFILVLFGVDIETLYWDYRFCRSADQPVTVKITMKVHKILTLAE